MPKSKDTHEPVHNQIKIPSFLSATECPKQTGLFWRKPPNREETKFPAVHTSDLPDCMEPGGSQRLIPCSKCQALGQPVMIWGILKGRSSGQVVPADARTIPENSPNRLADHEKKKLLAGGAEICYKAQGPPALPTQANKFRDMLLGRGIATSFRKLATERSVDSHPKEPPGLT